MSKIQELFKMAKQMQKQVQLSQGQLTKRIIEATSSERKEVSITSDGKFKILKVMIDDDIYRGPKEATEKHILAAFNNLSEQIEELSKQQILNISQNMEIPEELKDMDFDAEDDD